MIAKIIFSLLIVLTVGCKQSSVSTVSDASTTAESGENTGACVFYNKATKKVQANCARDQTQEECNESFKMYYEKFAPGEFEKELVIKTDCTDGKVKVAERLATASTSTGTTENGRCVCGGFVQRMSNQRYCLVARKTEKTANAKWEAVAQLPLVADCKSQCIGTNVRATEALASRSCMD